MSIDFVQAIQNTFLLFPPGSFCNNFAKLGFAVQALLNKQDPGMFASFESPGCNTTKGKHSERSSGSAMAHALLCVHNMQTLNLPS